MKNKNSSTKMINNSNEQKLLVKKDSEYLKDLNYKNKKEEKNVLG